MNIKSLLMAKKMGNGSGGSSGGMVVCTAETPNSNNYLTALEGLRVKFPNATEVGSFAFRYCTSLTTVDLPVATSIGDEAFYNCPSLTTVDLPMVTNIESNAFSSCSALTTVNLPVAIIIGNFAFRYCSALTTVDLPVAESIYKDAFYNCTSLTTVDLPVATSIGDEAFRNCTNLSAIILRKSDAICNINLTAILGTKIATAEGVPTGEGFIYIPTVRFEDYVANFAMQISVGFGLDEATADYMARAILRKIEDYPEICG